MLTVAHPHKTSVVISAEGTQTNRLVTVDDKRDVEPPLQRGGTVPQQHRVDPRILLTDILNLQNVVKVHPHPFYLELWALVYQLSIFIPGHKAQDNPPPDELPLNESVNLSSMGPNYAFENCPLNLMNTRESLILPLCFRRGEGRHIYL